MNYLNQSFLLLNPHLEELLQIKYIPDPEIFKSLSLDKCFYYFHRKDPLINFTKLQNNELFNINPLIENRILDENNLNSSIDFLEKLHNTQKLIDEKKCEKNIRNQIIDGSDNTLYKNADSKNLDIIMEEIDNNKKKLDCQFYENNNSKLETNNRLANKNSNKIIKRINDLKEQNFNDKSKDEIINDTNQENIKNYNSESLINLKNKMFVQLQVKDEIINGIILEKNKIKCAYKGCHKIFKNKYQLNEHLVSHSKNKLFICNLDNCVKEFKRRQTLNRHIRSFHQQVSKYKCKYCPVIYFNSNGILNLIYIYN